MRRKKTVGGTTYRNFYECSECSTRWTDEWDCQCDDRCPICNAQIQPHDSVEIELPHAT